MTKRKVPVLKDPQLSIAASLKSIRDWLARLADLAQAQADNSLGETTRAEARYSEVMAILVGIRADQDSQLREANRRLIEKVAEQAKTIRELQRASVSHALTEALQARFVFAD
jgi:hypothetical protein